MKLLMLSVTTEKPKITWSRIRPILVDVVDYFTGQQLSLQLSLHHKTMESEANNAAIFRNGKARITPIHKNRMNSNDRRQSRFALDLFLNFLGQFDRFLRGVNRLQLFTTFFELVVLLAKTKSKALAIAGREFAEARAIHRTNGNGMEPRPIHMPLLIVGTAKSMTKVKAYAASECAFSRMIAAQESLRPISSLLGFSASANLADEFHRTELYSNDLSPIKAGG
jgi:hypothetical protein